MNTIDCAKHLIATVERALSGRKMAPRILDNQKIAYKNYVVSILNDNAIFVAVYGAKTKIEHRSRRLLKILKLDDGVDHIVYHNDTYYRMAVVPTSISYRTLDRGDEMLTYVIKITNLTP